MKTTRQLMEDLLKGFLNQALLNQGIDDMRVEAIGPSFDTALVSRKLDSGRTYRIWVMAETILPEE